MKLKKRNIIIVIIIICISVLFVFFWNVNKNNKFYTLRLNGIIKDIKSNRKFENSKVAKFVGDSDFNYSFWIYAPDESDLKIGDSIYKAKDSENYQIYRIDSSGDYKFYKTLKNVP
ncbi:hypothetical protein [Chryseobacterium sp. JV558]|uniref:hypothetical protein n=1 Tax=Chryseobacterium sp. JV558 TaxID=2663236 RepID=UPI00299CFB67|nr:hypothetical protein [Chryseobacterium sp. JV558]MDW9378613.1 hypothetical protein [Chryseobacterium sp. JV558]